MPDPVELKPLQPQEALAFFRQKGFRLTYSWQDMFHQAHADAFTVAGVARLDVLQDLRSAIDDALAKGTTFGEFKKVAQQKLAARGWWGPVEVTDQATGQQKTVDLSRSSRLETIFNTNLRTSYNAGYWARIQRSKDVLPFLAYSAVLDNRTRPWHRRWGGGDPGIPRVVLPVDHPWWKTHMTPNGWRCRCTVVQMSQSMVDRAGLRVLTSAPDDGPDLTYRNKRTGEVFQVPRGIDPGFGYNVGETASFPDPAKYTTEALGQRAAQLSVESRGFDQLVSGQVNGTAPVAWLDDQVLKALDVQVRRVDLSSDTIAKQMARHPEITLDEYQQLPDLLQTGLVVGDGTGEAVRVYGQLGDGQPYAAVVKRTGSGQALFLVSFYRVNMGQVQAALAETPIRDNAGLRSALGDGQ